MKIKYKRTLANEITFISGFCLIMFPLYPSNKLIDYLKIAGVNIFYIALTLSTALYFLNNIKSGIKIWKDQLLSIILLIIILYQAYHGINLDRDFYLKDLTLYFSVLVIYWSFSWFFKKNKIDIYELLDYIFKGATICCTINILMYLTRSLSFWGVEFYAGGRFGGNYLTLNCITVPYAIYLIYSGKNRFSKVAIIYSLIVSMSSIILAQSRTLIIITVMGICITLIVELRNNVNKGIKLKRIKSLIIALMILLPLMIIFINSNAEILDRLSSFSNIESDTSFLVRRKLYSENFKIFIENIFGTGLGSGYPIYDSNGNLFQYLNFIDNTFLTIGEKLGIFALIIYLVLVVIRPIKYFLRCYKKKKNKVYYLTVLYYIAFLFLTTFSSAQSITSISASAVTWIIVAYCSTNKVI